MMPRLFFAHVRFVALLIPCFLLFQDFAYAKPKTTCGELLRLARRLDVVDGSKLLNLDSQVKLRQLLESDKLLAMDQLYISWTSKRDVDFYKKISDTYSGRQSPDLQATIGKWASFQSPYSAVNDFLREFVPPGEPLPNRLPRGAASNFSPTVLEWAQKMESAFSKPLLLPEGLLLFRGLQMNTKEIPRTGQKWNQPSFVSTSLDPEVAKNFASYEIGRPSVGEEQVIIVLQVGEGGVRAIPTNNWKEAELILPRGLEFRVNKRVRSGRAIAPEEGKTIILHAVVSDPQSPFQ